MDQFLQDLHKLAEDCDCGGIKDQPNRDRIVVGVLENDPSDDPQAKSDLTLG